MSLHRYHTPQHGAGIHIMRGGSLTRYHTPQLTSQKGAGLTETLMKIAGPSVVKAAQNTLRDIEGGKSLQQSLSQRGKELKKSLKRKAPSMVAATGTEVVRNKYKKAKRRVKDIFSL